MLGTFVQSVVMITDAAFLSRYSTLSFDASGNGGLIYVTLFMGLIGFGDAAQIIMARRIGQNKTEQINRIIQSAILVILSVALLFFLFTQTLLSDFILNFSKSSELALEQIDYLSIRSLGFFFALFMIVLNSFFLSIGKTWIIMIGSAVFAVSNIILDYLLIFGFGSVEPMGIKGAALASVLSEGIASLTLITILFRSKERIKYQIFLRLEIKFEIIKNLLRIGSPLVFQGMIALSSWTLFFIFIEQMGLHNLTVSQNVRFVYFLAFVPIFGFAATTKTYVAQYMDYTESNIIPKIIKRIQLLSFLFLLLIFHGALLYPEKLIQIINPETAYLTDSAFILRIMFGSILIYGLSSPLFHSISGSGNTRISLAIETLCTIFYVVYSYLTIKVWGWNITAVWSVEYLYFSMMGLLSLTYLKFSSWRKKVY
ncbi:MAG: MATE family efflux transporter [Brumimicrobium sp.]